MASVHVATGVLRLASVREWATWWNLICNSIMILRSNGVKIVQRYVGTQGVVIKMTVLRSHSARSKRIECSSQHVEESHVVLKKCSAASRAVQENVEMRILHRRLLGKQEPPCFQDVAHGHTHGLRSAISHHRCHRVCQIVV